MKVQATIIAAVAAVLPISTSAITVHLADFISSDDRSYYNSFEGIASSSSYISGRYWSSTYTEDNILVQQVNGSSMKIAPTIPDRPILDGPLHWYPYGGDFGYTKISLADGSAMDSFGALLASGRGSGFVDYYYEAFNDGQLVLNGALLQQAVSGLYLGFSGGGFDEIHVRSVKSGESLTTAANHLVLDGIEVVTPDVSPSVVNVSVPDAGSTATLFALSGLGLCAVRRFVRK